jgi:hypothetical protein
MATIISCHFTVKTHFHWLKFIEDFKLGKYLTRKKNYSLYQVILIVNDKITRKIVIIVIRENIILWVLAKRSELEIPFCPLHLYGQWIYGQNSRFDHLD